MHVSAFAHVFRSKFNVITQIEGAAPLSGQTLSLRSKGLAFDLRVRVYLQWNLIVHDSLLRPAVLRAATGVTACDRPETACDRAAKLPVTL